MVCNHLALALGRRHSESSHAMIMRRYQGVSIPISGNDETGADGLNGKWARKRSTALDAIGMGTFGG